MTSIWSKTENRGSQMMGFDPHSRFEDLLPRNAVSVIRLPKKPCPFGSRLEQNSQIFISVVYILLKGLHLPRSP